MFAGTGNNFFFCVALCLWFLDKMAYSIDLNQSKQDTANHSLAVFILLYMDRHLSSHHGKSLLKKSYGKVVAIF